MQDILKDEKYLTIYDTIRQGEMQAKEILLDFQQAYPGIMKEDNVDGILESKARTKASILEQLNALKKLRDTQKSDDCPHKNSETE